MFVVQILSTLISLPCEGSTKICTSLTSLSAIILTWVFMRNIWIMKLALHPSRERERERASYHHIHVELTIHHTVATSGEGMFGVFVALLKI